MNSCGRANRRRSQHASFETETFLANKNQQMAKSRKPDQPADTNPPELSFEDSLAELQRIVEELEQGALGLEESMRRFEQGIAFLRGCYKTLEEAKQKIEILTGTD